MGKASTTISNTPATPLISHTPGPWSVGKWDSRTNGWHIDAETCPHIASALYMGGTALAKDNAHLISAAPDLLAVCESTLVKLDHLHQEGVVKMPLTMDRLRAAIAKARGES